MQTTPTNQPNIDDFWTHDAYLFQGSFRYYRNTSRPVRGKIYVSEGSYRLDDFELDIRPMKTRKGMRTYIMMHPYVPEPILTVRVGLYDTPKNYADQDAAIGETIGGVQQEGIRDVQIGNAQAWYYHQDKTIEIWECFLWEGYRAHPFVADPYMLQLWKAFEQWLQAKFPEATDIVTPFNDLSAETIEEYQTFLRSLGYQPVAKSAFGKAL
jgi:hypothetical protein